MRIGDREFSVFIVHLYVWSSAAWQVVKKLAGGKYEDKTKCGKTQEVMVEAYGEEDGDGEEEYIWKGRQG